VAEDHASNPLKTALGKLKAKGVKVVAINPIRTGYGAIADEWIGVRPGTDGLFVGALIHELIRAEKIDLEYLVRFTNAPWLVIDDPQAGGHGLFARDANGKPLAFDRTAGALADATRVDIAPALVGEFKLPDGRNARPSFALIAERFLTDEYAPDTVAAKTAIPAETIRRIAGELAQAAFEQTVTLDLPWTDWAGRRHDKTIGRPISMHAMRGISAHANGFQTCRMIHLLQNLLGSIDCPGGFRYSTFPRPTLPPNRPARASGPNAPLKGGALDFRRDRRICWSMRGVSAAGSTRPIPGCATGRARPDAHGHHQRRQRRSLSDRRCFCSWPTMSWNSAMNIPAVLEHLTAKDPTGDYRIPKIIYSDAYASEMIAYADLIPPDTTYLERWDCIRC
jgi:anaerobic selenocysteine-containing dehydrogenase